MATDKNTGFTAAEKAAMKEHAAELRAAAKRQKSEDAAAAEAAECAAAIAKLDGTDRELAQGVHDLIAKVAPELKAKTWYGMPAYALGGKTVCFFQAGSKFKTRYSTLGFTENAKLDDGEMWPNAYALLELTPAASDRISALLRQSIGA